MILLNEKIYIDYQKKYFSKSKFKIIEKIFLVVKIQTFLTIEIKENEKILNNFSNPIYLDNINFDQKLHTILIEKIKRFI